MTIQWLLIASFLYLELGAITLLILPFISSRIWKSILQFHLWRSLLEKANSYFIVFLLVLVLFFLDAVREMIKYSGEHSYEHDAELQIRMKLFRSQRNYYIVGIAIFLVLVVRRLVELIFMESELLNRNEDAMKKAEEATQTLEKLAKEMKQTEVKSIPNVKYLEEIEKLKSELKNKDLELELAQQDIENLKNRHKQVSEDCQNLISKITELRGSVN